MMSSTRRFASLFAFGAALLAGPRLGQATPLAQSVIGPQVAFDFPAAKASDLGTVSLPDATIGVGPNHIVEVAIGHLSIFDRVTGVRLQNSNNTALFTLGVLQQLGTRVLYDPHSQRFIAAAYGHPAKLNLAVSASSDPTGPWFRASIDAAQGVDAGRQIEFIRLGYNATGIFLSAPMFGSSSVTSTIWAIDKAPLLAANPSLGAVTAFRDLPHQFSIVPSETWEVTDSETLIGIDIIGECFEVWRIDGPMTAPTLQVSGGGCGLPPAYTTSIPALGSSPNLNVLDFRFQNAVYHEGSIWTARTSDAPPGHALVQWFEIDAVTAEPIQQGTIQHPERSYFIPSVGVNQRGDVAISFCGSSPNEYVGAYIAGRHANERPGVLSDPQLLRAGAGPQNPFGAHWGHYVDLARDPADPDRLWCLGLYARQSNRWGTQLAQLEFPCEPAQSYCDTSPNSVGAGSLMGIEGVASVANNDLVLLASRAPDHQFGIFYYGAGAAQVPFGDGFRCIGGNTFRLPVTSVGNDGVARWPLDLTAPPHPSGQITAGSTWRFQFWYRDPAFGGTGFNLSDGLAIPFCP